MASAGATGRAIWKVVGGEDKGGILVRDRQELSSSAEPIRLSTGSTVEERERAGDRLRYQLRTGFGPDTGWVSIRLQGKVLLEKMPQRVPSAAPQQRSPLSGQAADRQPRGGGGSTAAAPKGLDEIKSAPWREAEEMTKRKAEKKASSAKEEQAIAEAEAEQKRHHDLDERARTRAEEARRPEPERAIDGDHKRLAAERRRREAEERRRRLAAEREQGEAEARRRRLARERTAGTCSAEVEARFASLEQLADQQQGQIQRLSDFCAHLFQEVSDLHRAHSTLHRSHWFLSDVLVGSNLLIPAFSSAVLPSQARQRSQLGGRVHPIFAALADGSAVPELWRLLGEPSAELVRLSMASRAFGGVREEIERLSATACMGEAAASSSAKGSSFAPKRLAHHLDVGSWQNLKKYEPASSVIDQWEKSQTVQAVVGGLRTVEGAPGKLESVRFSDVHKVLTRIGLPLEHFINKFRHVPTTRAWSDAKALDEATDLILSKFANQRVEGKNRMTCRDLYRMLEIVGIPLQKFKNVFPNAAVVQDNPSDGNLLMIGSYKIRRQIGQGFKGVRCYLGEHSTDGTRAAVKWPAPVDEVLTMKEIHKKAAKDCLGMPHLLASGTFQSKSYLAIEYLGAPLSNIFHRLLSCPFQERWFALCVIGRMVVRRLQSFHSHGFVHCDISPDNLLMGRARDASGQALYLIDYELAQRFPGGEKVEGNIGSSEWSSIRSAGFVERLPEDDLEALGWMLLHGLIGTLPWIEWLNCAYNAWESKWAKMRAVKQVQRAKAGLLDKSPGAEGWRRSVGMPDELLSYLRSCHAMAEKPGSADYPSLLSLLGGDKSLNEQEAERLDLRQFAEHVVPLL